jgi:protein-histidine pros-kinase
MTDRNIRGIIRRDLLIVFLIALVAGGGGFYWLLENAARENAEQEAKLVLSSAMGMRDYTTNQILPRLSDPHDAVFHEETVPSFAAQSVFRSVSMKETSYSYHESALNPTALADRADPFEVELIRNFGEMPGLAETQGILNVNGEKLFYLARPIRIDDRACLTCHDTPARAPKTMLAKYGSENGFGWKLGQVIGVQLVTVPVTRQFRSSLQLVAILIGALAVIFAIAFFALNAAMDAAVARPLAELAKAADDASRSDRATPPLPLSGVREIRILSQSLQRLRESLAKALERLRAGESDHE